MLADTLQYVDEVVVRIDVVEPTGRQQALHNADMLGAQLGPAEQPVFFHRDDPQGGLEVVRVDRYLWVIQADSEVSEQPGPVLMTALVTGLGQCTWRS